MKIKRLKVLLTLIAVCAFVIGFMTMFTFRTDYNAIAETGDEQVLTGNLVNVRNFKWGVGEANISKVLTQGIVSDDDGEYFKVESNKGVDPKDTYPNPIWQINNLSAYQYVGGLKYKVSLEYKTSETLSGATVTVASYANHALVKSTSIKNATTTWTEMNYEFEIQNDFVLDSTKTNSFRFIFNNLCSGDCFYLKNIKMEIVGGGFNLVDASKIRQQNPNMTGSLSSEGEHSIFTASAATNLAAGVDTNEIKWQKDKKYVVSLDLKTNSVSTNFYLYFRMGLNNAFSDVKLFGTNISGERSEWTTYSFIYIPTADGTISKNVLRLQIGVNAGDIVYLRDVSVILLESNYDGYKNIVNSGDSTFKKANGGLNFTKSETPSDLFGKAYKVSMGSDISNAIIWQQDVLWTKGATYTLFFMVKNSGTSTATMSVQARIKGYNNKELVNKTNCMSGVTNYWKPVYFTFTLDDSFITADQSKTYNTFDFIINGKAGDEIYFTEVKLLSNVVTVSYRENVGGVEKTTKNMNVVKGEEFTLPERENDGKMLACWEVTQGSSVEYASPGDKVVFNKDYSVIRPVLIDYTTEEDAYFRANTNNPGIRFTANIAYADIQTLNKKFGEENIQFGIRIKSPTKVGKLDIVAEKWIYSGAENEINEFACVLSGFEDIVEDCYNTEFTGTAYLKITIGEKVITVMTNSSNAKTVAGMAKNIKEDADVYNGLTDAEKSVIDSFSSRYISD